MALQKKIASNCEAAIVLEGLVGFVEEPVSVLIRLAKPVVLADLPEVDIPTRFIYLYVGKKGPGTYSFMALLTNKY